MTTDKECGMLHGPRSRIGRILSAPEDRSPKARRSIDPRTAPIDGLVQSLDLRSLRGRLKSHPEQVHEVDDRGDHLTHHAAQRGAVMVGELLFAHGADPLANDARGLWPGHVAAATKHPNCALYMLERAKLQGRRETWRTTLDTLTTQLEPPNPSPSNAQLLAITSELTGLPARVLDDPREKVKLLAQLEELKGQVAGVDGEGWWQHRFIPQRVRSLVAFLWREETGDQEAELIRREIQIMLDAHRTAERLHTLKKLNSRPVTTMAVDIEAKQMASRIIELKEGQAYCIPTGWDGHALYVGIRRIEADGPNGPEPRLQIQIENVGEGRTKAHEVTKEGCVKTITFQTSVDLLMTADGGKKFDEFLRGILLSKAVLGTTEDDFYVQVARFKGFLNDKLPAKVVADGVGAVSMPPQTAGNCTTINAHIGMRARLGDKLFERFRTFEGEFAKKLIRDNKIDFFVELRRYDRDFEQLKEILETRGPWTNRLKALFKTTRKSYSHILAERLTYEDLHKVVQAKEHEALQQLLIHGARDMYGGKGESLLHAAAAVGNAKMCASLIEFGCPVTILDEAGNSALHIAAEEGASGAIQVLIDGGADLDQPNDAGLTPRDILKDKVDEVHQLARFTGATSQCNGAPKRTLV